MLHILKLGHFTGHPSLKEMFAKVSATCRLITEADKKLQEWVAGFVVEGVTKNDIRVPLDITRDNVKSTKWLPLSLEELAPGGQVDLVLLLDQLNLLSMEYGIHINLPVSTFIGSSTQCSSI